MPELVVLEGSVYASEFLGKARASVANNLRLSQLATQRHKGTVNPPWWTQPVTAQTVGGVARAHVAQLHKWAKLYAKGKRPRRAALRRYAQARTGMFASRYRRRVRRVGSNVYDYPELMGGRFWRRMKRKVRNVGRKITRPVRKITAPVRRVIARTPIVRTLNRAHSVVWNMATLRPGKAFRQAKRGVTDVKKDIRAVKSVIRQMSDSAMDKIANTIGESAFMQKGTKTAVIASGTTLVLPLVKAQPYLLPGLPFVPIALGRAYDALRREILNRLKGTVPRAPSVTKVTAAEPEYIEPEFIVDEPLPEEKKPSMAIPLVIAAGVGLLAMKG